MMHKLALALLFFALVVCSFCDEGQNNHDNDHQDIDWSNSNDWELVPALTPGPTYIGGHSMVTRRERLYVFGGFFEDFANFSNSFFDRFWSFSVHSRIWRLLSSGPSARAFHSACGDDDNMFVYGGVTYNGFFGNITVFADFWAFEYDTNTWHQIFATNAGPGPRADHNIVLIDDNIYLFGGVVNKFFTEKNDLWAYNIPTNTWTQLIGNNVAGSPTKRDAFYMEPVSINDQSGFIVSMGETFNGLGGFADLSDLWFYSIDSNTYRNISPANNPNIANSAIMAVVRRDRDLVIFGGDIPGGARGCHAPFNQDPTNTTWTFNLDTLAWAILPTTHTPPSLKRHSAGVIDGKFYIFGGWGWHCPPGQLWNNNVYVLRFAERHPELG